MNNLAQDTMTKPQSDDMSMDEILASIRKIISSEKTPSVNADKKKAPAGNHNTVASASHYEGGVHFNQMMHHEQRVAAEENDISSLRSAQSKRPSYQKLSEGCNDDSAENRSVSSETYDQDAEILNALNEIRDNLSISTTPASPPQPKNIAQHQSETLSNHKKTDLPEAPVNEYQYDELDLKPTYFSSDTAPEFLKRFKKQQLSEREKHKEDNSQKVEYDFSSAPNFDEQGEVVTLTEKVMPTSKAELAEDNKLEISELRKKTEEIMRNSSQYRIADTHQEEDFQGTSPITSIIKRVIEPMIQEWIQENMQEIAEQVLRDEFRRGLK